MPFSSGLPQSFHHWKGLGGIPREVLVMPPSVQPETPLKRKWSQYLLALPSKNLNFPSASPILSQNIPTPPLLQFCRGFLGWQGVAAP